MAVEHAGDVKAARTPSAATLVGQQLLVAVAVVSWGDRHVGGDDVVDAVEDVRARRGGSASRVVVAASQGSTHALL